MRVVHGGGHRYALSGGRAYTHAHHYGYAYGRRYAYGRHGHTYRHYGGGYYASGYSYPYYAGGYYQCAAIDTTPAATITDIIMAAGGAATTIRMRCSSWCYGPAYGYAAPVYGYSYEPSYGYAYGVYGGSWRGRHRGYAWNGGRHGGRGHTTPLIGAGHINASPRSFAVAHGGAHFGGHMHGHFMH